MQEEKGFTRADGMINFSSQHCTAQHHRHLNTNKR